MGDAETGVAVAYRGRGEKEGLSETPGNRED